MGMVNGVTSLLWFMQKRKKKKKKQKNIESVKSKKVAK